LRGSALRGRTFLIICSFDVLDSDQISNLDQLLLGGYRLQQDFSKIRGVFRGIPKVNLQLHIIIIMKFLETSEEIQGNFEKPETSHRYRRGAELIYSIRCIYRITQ
jgi:hypothetical protein